MSAAARSDPPPVVRSFLMTDIVGSTRWWDRHPAEMDLALDRHDTLLGEAVRSHGGTLIQSKGEGDSTFSVFDRATDAVAAAWSAQLALAAEDWALPEPLHVRMAVYTGETVSRGGTFYGTTINRTARLRAIAGAGEVLVGGTTADLVIDHLRGELVLTDLGLHHLRDLDRPERVFRLERAGAAEGGRARAGDDTGAVPLPIRFGRTDGVGLVGRTTELDALRAACAATIDDGAFRAVFISGESGIGKTRLCGELARAAHADGAIVLAGRCSERARTPFGPFGQALGALARHAPGNIVEHHARLHHGALGRIVPELNERVTTVAESEVADADTARHLAFRSVVSFLEAAARGNGLVLILDDLHWADAASLDLLGHLLLAEPPERVLVVGTYRDTELAAGADLGSLLADAWREPGVERVRLRGLQHADIVELMENASGKALGSAGETLSTTLEIETGGNPFLLTEMLRNLRESGLVEQADDGTWELPAIDDVARLGLPDRVHDVVGRRVRRLGEEAQVVLSVAAVIGTEFEPTLVGAVMGVDASRVHDELEQAAAAAIVQDLGPARGFAFAHAITRRTLLQQLPRHRRERLHAAVGDLLDRAGTTTAARLAAHYVAAGDAAPPGKATAAATSAGDQALASLAPADAVRWYRTALEVTPGSEQRTRLELEVRLGRAQRQAGDRAYRTTLLAAAAAARDAGAHDVLVEAVLANHRRHGSLTGGVDRERVAMLRSAVDLAGDDPTVRARLLAILASELTFDTDRNSTLAIADEALALARRSGDEPTLLAVHLARFLTVLAPDRRDDAIACSIDLLALARRLDDRAALVFAATYRAYACLWTADIEGVDEALAVADAAAEPLGQPLLRHVVRVVQAMRASIAGRYDEAERLSGDAYELGQAGGLTQAAAHHMGQLYRIRLAQGRLDELVPTFEALVREQPAHPARRIVLCGLYCRLDRREDAEALFAEDAAAEFARLPWDRYSLMMLASYAYPAVYLDRPRSAEVLYDRMRPFADQIAFGDSTCMGSVSLYCGMLATMLGRFDAAEEHLVEAERAHRALDSPAFLAATRAEQATMCLRRDGPGDRVRAAGLLELAIDEAETVGATAMTVPWRRLGDTLAQTR